jgi:HPt (histidine-containing phosphotransfer) domain-containing protein
MSATLVLDREALTRLGSDIQDCEFAISFARRYCSMLDNRVRRILDALLDGDLVAAMDSVLSLKVSSSTVGTHELAHLALAVEQHVRCRDVVAARQQAAALADAADRAETALADYLAAYRAG